MQLRTWAFRVNTKGDRVVEPSAERKLKVGELAERTNKTVRALRLYEERGLLTPAERSQGGFRLYSKHSVDRVSLIDRLQSVGMSLSEISDLLSVWNDAETNPFGLRRLQEEYKRRLLDVRARIEALQEVETLLEEGVTFIDGCQPCVPQKSGCGCNDCDRFDTGDSDLLMVTGVTG